MRVRYRKWGGGTHTVKALEGRTVCQVQVQQLELISGAVGILQFKPGRGRLRARSRSCPRPCEGTSACILSLGFPICEMGMVGALIPQGCYRVKWDLLGWAGGRSPQQGAGMARVSRNGNSMGLEGRLVGGLGWGRGD